MKVSASTTRGLPGFEAWMKTGLDKRLKSAVDKSMNKIANNLEKNTPKDTGETATSYRIVKMTTKSGYEVSIVSSRADIVRYCNYGHLDRGGGYVRGSRFVTKSVQPVMKELDEDIEAVFR